MTEPRWEQRPAADRAAEEHLVRELRASPLLARLLVGRGLAEPEEAATFLRPRLASLEDPLATGEIEAAVRRLVRAVEKRETVVLYGDYDVDGVTSLALLHRFLLAEGLPAGCFLPMRQGEGYGLSSEGLQRLLETRQPDLVVALDCGTSSCAEAALLQDRGIDLIIVDHHEPAGERPACVALVNPKVSGGNTTLCTAGLVFKLCHAWQKMTGSRAFSLREGLDLVALGTICDLALMAGENRILTRHGLAVLGRTRWVGLQALMALGAVREPVGAMDVGFRLGPRLNAAGRLDTAENALQLLLTDDPKEAAGLAQGLDRRNRERQELETRVLEAALRQAGERYDPGHHRALVLGDDGWHQGVLGIVASRLCRQFHRPAIVVGFGPDGPGRGSGRSIPGFNLVEALRACGHTLEKCGGHQMAAGLSVTREQFTAFRSAFLEEASRRLSEEELQPSITLDAQVAIEEICFEHLDELSLLEPCGQGNPAPLFYLRAVSPVDEPKVLKGRHLRFSLRGRSGNLPAIFFNGASRELPRMPWDVAFRISRNEFRDQVVLQLEVQHLRSAVA